MLVRLYALPSGEPLRAALAEQGHITAVTTNLNSIDPDEIAALFPEGSRRRVLFFASLHYFELQRRGRLDHFFDHLLRLRQAGFSWQIRLCLAPEYLPVIDEIDQLCRQRTGQLPVLTRWRDIERRDADMTALDRIGERSAVYKLQKQCADVRRREFCHAGEFTVALDLGSGRYRACLAEPAAGELRPEEESGTIAFPLTPAGENCHARWCMCCSHLLPWGVIPELDPGSCGEFFFPDGGSNIDPGLLAMLSARRPGEAVDRSKGDI